MMDSKKFKCNLCANNFDEFGQPIDYYCSSAYNLNRHIETCHKSFVQSQLSGGRRGNDQLKGSGSKPSSRSASPVSGILAVDAFQLSSKKQKTGEPKLDNLNPFLKT